MRKIVRLFVCGILALPAFGQTTLNGAGATFPAPIYSKWFSEYHNLHSNIQVNYQPIGSGGGIRQVTEATVDFGASDMPMTDEQLKEAEAKLKTKVLNLPTVLGAVVPAYNIPGVTGEVKFTPDVLAGIFLGKISNWNDAAISKENPGGRQHFCEVAERSWRKRQRRGRRIDPATGGLDRLRRTDLCRAEPHHL